MEKAEPFMALVIYPTTAEAQTRQADNLVRIPRPTGCASTP
jgi:hypothetical protein